MWKRWSCYCSKRFVHQQAKEDTCKRIRFNNEKHDCWDILKDKSCYSEIRIRNSEIILALLPQYRAFCSFSQVPSFNRQMKDNCNKLCISVLHNYKGIVIALQIHNYVSIRTHPFFTKSCQFNFKIWELELEHTHTPICADLLRGPKSSILKFIPLNDTFRHLRTQQSFKFLT